MDKITACGRQTALRFLGIGAGEHIGPVPDRVQETHTPLSHCLHLIHVAVDEVGALDAQQRGRLSFGHRLVHLPTGTAMAGDVGVIIHLAQEEIVHPPALCPQAVCGSLCRIMEQGKKLSTAAELSAAFQVDMAAVFSQMSRCGIIAALLLPAVAVVQRRGLARLKAAVNGIAVGVKIRYHRSLLTEKHF